MTNDKILMTNQAQNPNDKTYDLSERTAVFGENVIAFTKKLPRNEINKPLINQTVRSSTSIGANYMEADCADTKKDFRYKISLCKKEAKESMHWFRMFAKANPSHKQECRDLWQEAHELTLIFSSIVNSIKNKKS